METADWLCSSDLQSVEDGVQARVASTRCLRPSSTEGASSRIQHSSTAPAFYHSAPDERGTVPCLAEERRRPHRFLWQGGSSGIFIQCQHWSGSGFFWRAADQGRCWTWAWRQSVCWREAAFLNQQSYHSTADHRTLMKSTHFYPRCQQGKCEIVTSTIFGPQMCQTNQDCMQYQKCNNLLDATCR